MDIILIKYFNVQPAPMTELRVKGEISNQAECIAAQGVRIVARDLEKAMPGLPLYVANNDEEVAYYKHELNMQLENALKSIKLSNSGLYVQTSTIGSLEALLVFLRQQKIPFSGINIGPVQKKDVVKATAIKKRDSKWGVILAFNVKVAPEIELMAKANGILIFRQQIMYRLFDDIMIHLNELASANKERLKDQVVYPVAFKIMPEFIFQNRNPILVGVEIESGIMRLGTPLCVQSETGLIDIGRVMSIEQNRHPISEAKAGQQVCVRIDPMHGEQPKMLGRNFKVTDLIFSRITRESIDILKEFYRDELSNNDWRLVKQLKSFLGIL